MGMIVTMKKATLKMIRLLWAGSNQLRRQCNRVVPRPVNLWVHRLHLDGSTNKSETSNFLQMTILAKPLRTHRNVPLCHQHSLQSWLNNGPGCRAWKERWVGLGLTTGRGSSTLSKNFSLAPNLQFTHSGFTSGGVIPEKISLHSHVSYDQARNHS